LLNTIGATSSANVTDSLAWTTDFPLPKTKKAPISVIEPAASHILLLILKPLDAV
jgi:hypothetical protein